MTSGAQTWAVRSLWVVILAGAVVFWQDYFRASDAALVIAAVGYLGGPAVLGGVGGFKPLATVAVALLVLIWGRGVVYGIDDIGVEAVLASAFPSGLILAFGAIPAGIRLLWRRRSGST